MLTPAPLPDAPPAWAVRLVMGLRRALLRLADRVVPPNVAVIDAISGVGRTVVLAALANLKVPDELEKGPATAEALAARTGANPDALKRTLRAAAAQGLLKRGADGRYRGTPLSSALTDKPDTMRAMAQFIGSKASVEAWADFGQTLLTGKNGFARVHGASVWHYLAEHPAEEAVFAQAMTNNTLSVASALAACYPFDEVSRVCDVGGGRGTLLSEILVRHPKLKGMLVDGEGPLSLAHELLKARQVADRVELVPGSFFDQVPAGCDAYILKSVLHDWDDERSLAILKNCRKAVAPGGRVLLMETLVEETSVDFPVLADLQMMMATDEGRERSKSELERLLEHGGFRPGRHFETSLYASVLEGVAV